MDIKELLNYTEKNHASDLHLSANNVPLLRLHGNMVPIKVPKLENEELRTMLLSLMTEKEQEKYKNNFELDFIVDYSEKSRFRANAFNTHNGVAAVFRAVPTRVLSLQEIGAPPIFERFSSLPSGLVLVTGPTGSGKSTTLAAILDHININHDKHIITIEDPIEFVHQSKKSLINQREVGKHTHSFSNALRSALREDPDVILIGELRDLETVKLALEASETGHLVLASLHTSSAAKTIDRMIGIFPAEERDLVRNMLSSSIQAIIAQLLFKKSDEGGRVAVHEILVATSAIRNLIREDKIPQITSIMQVGMRYGMKTMQDAARTLANQGIISLEDANALASSDDERTLEAPSEKKGMEGTKLSLSSKKNDF